MTNGKIQAMLNLAMRNNPMYSRAKQMVEGKNEQQLEELAENLCKQRGIDLDSAVNQFKQIINQ